MKRIHTLHLALLIALLPGMAVSQDEPINPKALAGIDAEAALSKLAATKEAAVLRLDIRIGRGRMIPLNGVFISDDGLALVELGALSTEAKPTGVTADGTALEFGNILSVFPSHGLALVKFDCRPAAHLKVASNMPAVGETIALVPCDNREPGVLKGGIPPVVGPILVINSRRGVFGHGGFVKSISLGSSLTMQQRSHVAAGTVAINQEGALVGIFHSQSHKAGSRLLLLNSVADLADVIRKIDRKKEGIPFPPLPDAGEIFEPYEYDHDYLRISDLGAQHIEPEEVIRILRGLLTTYPKSHRLKDMALGYSTRRDPLVSLDDFPELDPAAPVAQQISVLSCRAFFLKEEAAIKARKKAIALSPKDYPNDRIMLAFLYKRMKRFDEAEEMLREVYPYVSDHVGVLDIYRGMLLEKHKWEELEIVERRIDELDRVYRRR